MPGWHKRVSCMSWIAVSYSFLSFSGRSVMWLRTFKVSMPLLMSSWRMCLCRLRNRSSKSSTWVETSRSFSWSLVIGRPWLRSIWEANVMNYLYSKNNSIGTNSPIVNVAITYKLSLVKFPSKVAAWTYMCALWFANYWDWHALPHTCSYVQQS